MEVVDVLREEVHQLLSVQRELCCAFTLHLKEQQQLQANTIMKRLLKSKQSTFTASQASVWLAGVFVKHELEWKEDHAMHVVEFLWKQGYIDFKDIPACDEFVTITLQSARLY